MVLALGNDDQTEQLVNVNIYEHARRDAVMAWSMSCLVRDYRVASLVGEPGDFA